MGKLNYTTKEINSRLQDKNLYSHLVNQGVLKGTLCRGVMPLGAEPGFVYRAKQYNYNCHPSDESDTLLKISLPLPSDVKNINLKEVLHEDDLERVKGIIVEDPNPDRGYDVQLSLEDKILHIECYESYQIHPHFIALALSGDGGRNTYITRDTSNKIVEVSEVDIKRRPLLENDLFSKIFLDPSIKSQLMGTSISERHYLSCEETELFVSALMRLTDQRTDLQVYRKCKMSKNVASKRLFGANSTYKWRTIVSHKRSTNNNKKTIPYGTHVNIRIRLSARHKWMYFHLRQCGWNEGKYQFFETYDGGKWFKRKKRSTPWPEIKSPANDTKSTSA